MKANATSTLLTGISMLTAPALAGTLKDRFPERFHETASTRYGTTHFEQRGETARPTVVLIHGVSGPMSVWDSTTEALTERGYRVLRYDLFGRGFSERKTPEAYGLSLYVHQLEALLETLAVREPIALVGSSFGAVIATEFALQHPDRVRGVVLVGPAGFPIKTPVLAKLRDVPVLGPLLTRVAGRRTILEQNRKYFADGAPPAAFWSYFEAQLDEPGTLDAMLATMRQAPVQSYVDSYRLLGRTGLPVGVIWGRADATFPYEHHRTLLAAVPSARLQTVENAAHLPQLERPELTSAALADLLGSFPAAAPPSAGPFRAAYPATVSATLTADPIDNAARFDDAFFRGFPTEPRRLELAPGVEKEYLFPTFYADVTTSAALFLADYRVAAGLLPEGMKPMRALPGKAVVAISSYRYGAVRGLLPYNEAAISILLDRATAHVISMPVTTLENRIRGHRIWGLPKEVRPIELREVGNELVTTVFGADSRPAWELRVPSSGRVPHPSSGRSMPLPSRSRMTLRTVRNGEIFEAISESAGLFTVRWRAGALAVEGDSPEARTLRSLKLSPVPWRTQSASGLNSAFGLPRRHAMTGR